MRSRAMVRPAFLVALVAALAAAGVSLAFTAASRARVLRSGVVARELQSPVPRPHAKAPGRAGGKAHRAGRHAGPRPVLVLRVRRGRTVTLRDRPGGRAIARLGDRTDFGSRMTLSVVRRRGRWASVPATALGNGRRGWVDTSDTALDRRTTNVRLVILLSSRRLELRVRGRLRRSVPIAVGRPANPTPRGRFAVTDRMAGGHFGPYYGCCIIALTGHQPNTPPGWRGGDRLAIHGTNAPSSIGTPSSAGCLRAFEGDLRVLMRRVPLGTPVIIRG
jgi:lipoprotein-anchoring transpeptidase ErfK/SrfK